GGIGALGGQRVVGGGEAGLGGVVAVDDRHVGAGQAAGQMGGLHLDDLKVFGVGGDVLLGGGQAGVGGQLDQALGGQQLQGAGLVGGIVGNKDLRAIRSEEHTSELQSRFDLVCRLLLEKKNTECNFKTRLQTQFHFIRIDCYRYHWLDIRL